MWTWALLARIAKQNVPGHTIICMASCDTILNSYNTSTGPHPMVSIDENIQPSLQPFLSTSRSPRLLPLTNMKMHNRNHEQMLIYVLQEEKYKGILLCMLRSMIHTSQDLTYQYMSMETCLPINPALSSPPPPSSPPTMHLLDASTSYPTLHSMHLDESSPQVLQNRTSQGTVE